jgi:hypothetical protein
LEDVMKWRSIILEVQPLSGIPIAYGKGRQVIPNKDKEITFASHEENPAEASSEFESRRREASATAEGIIIVTD